MGKGGSLQRGPSSLRTRRTLAEPPGVLKHPNIVRYYDRIIDRTNTTLYIVMECCEGGDLASVIAKGTKER